MVYDDSQQDYVCDMFVEFVIQVFDEGMVVDKDIVVMINDCISQIDVLISDQFNQIIYYFELQKLEVFWCGLY